MQPPITVLGAGSWGTALALQLARNGNPTRLWGHEAAHMAQLSAERVNARYLPDIAFPANLEPVIELEAALADEAALFVVVPSHAFATTLERIHALRQPQAIAWATKGFESGTGRLLHEVASELLGPDTALAVVSGPSFATEVAQQLPTAVTVAANDTAFAQAWVERLHSERFRAYRSSDLTGVELGGAVKNVLAIAAGIADGLGFGANARAALITRGLAEIMRLGALLGAQPETLTGLAGLGDLLLTCTDNQSRNRRFGLALAAGKTQAQAAAEIGQEVEGVYAAREVVRRGAALGVELPIAQTVAAVLADEISCQEAVQRLLVRAPKAETR